MTNHDTIRPVAILISSPGGNQPSLVARIWEEKKQPSHKPFQNIADAHQISNSRLKWKTWFGNERTRVSVLVRVRYCLHGGEGDGKG